MCRRRRPPSDLRTTADDTDWSAMVGRCTRLGELRPSPLIVLNQAVAASCADGPAAALAVVDAVSEAP